MQVDSDLGDFSDKVFTRKNTCTQPQCNECEIVPNYETAQCVDDSIEIFK